MAYYGGNLITLTRRQIVEIKKNAAAEAIETLQGHMDKLKVMYKEDSMYTVLLTTAYVLAKRGFDGEELDEIADEVADTWEAIDRKEVDFEDMEKWLLKEKGFALRKEVLE